MYRAEVIEVRAVIDARELEAESARSQMAFRQHRRRVWFIMRKVAFAGERGIKDAMPVDTGRARASWGHWSAGDIRRISSNADFGPGDAINQENENALEIEQGTNVEYVEYLNEGHSQQAPAGFIDAIAEKAERELEAQINAMPEELGG